MYVFSSGSNVPGLRTATRVLNFPRNLRSCLRLPPYRKLLGPLLAFFSFLTTRPSRRNTTLTMLAAEPSTLVTAAKRLSAQLTVRLADIFSRISMSSHGTTSLSEPSGQGSSHGGASLSEPGGQGLLHGGVPLSEPGGQGLLHGGVPLSEPGGQGVTVSGTLPAAFSGPTFFCRRPSTSRPLWSARGSARRLRLYRRPSWAPAGHRR